MTPTASSTSIAAFRAARRLAGFAAVLRSPGAPPRKRNVLLLWLLYPRRPASSGPIVLNLAQNVNKNSGQRGVPRRQ